jgi:hypothetical protein
MNFSDRIYTNMAVAVPDMAVAVPDMVVALIITHS